MKFDRWDQLGALFIKATDLPPNKLDAFLESECGDDAEMIQELKSLLAADEKASAAAFMEVAPELLAEITDEEVHDDDASADPILGTEVGQYRLVRQIGRGGMGVVYEAKDTRLGRAVALKFVLPELSAHERIKRRFIREAKAASALDHKNICTVYDIGETDDGRIFIAMAFYDGQTLKEKIKSGPIDLEECIDIAIQITEGLERAHEVGIVHRDLKPANVVVTERGEVKILDFGIAKFEGLSRITKSGARLGTPRYMSPEGMMPNEEVGPKADIWGLGVVLYEMVTGVQPFRGETDVDVIRAILNDDPTPVQQVRPEATNSLWNLISDLLEKDPEARVRSMEVAHFRLLDTILK